MVNFLQDIHDMVGDVPHFGYSHAVDYRSYCNKDNYQDLESPVEVFYSFEFYNAAAMHSNVKEQIGKPLLDVDQLFTMGSKDLSKLNRDLQKKFKYEALNDELIKQVRHFFLDIEAVANIRFIESEMLVKNEINMVISGIDRQSPAFSKDMIAYAVNPVEDFKGSLIYIRDVHDKFTPQEILKDLQHEILHGLCADHPKFPDMKTEKKYRSMVEDETTSWLWRKCLAGAVMNEAVLKCAKKVGASNQISLMRCSAAIVDERCIHAPKMLTPIDVKHLQYVFGESTKEDDSTNFRARFVNKYKPALKFEL